MIDSYIAIQTAYAHVEEGEEASISASDYVGPGLTLLILIAAVIIARRIRNK